MSYTQVEKNRNFSRTVREGFTMIELMVVIAILALLAVFAVPALYSKLASAKDSKARIELKTLQSSIREYKVYTNKFPSRLTDLVRPADEKDKKKIPGGKLLEELPEDPWGNQYQYKPTPGGAHEFDLYSWGENERGAPQSEWISAWDAIKN